MAKTHNGQPQPIQPMVQNAMFYPNTYINFTQAGEYTKHYYNGTERICSRLGEQQVTISVENEQELEAYKQDVKQMIYNAIGQHLYDEPTDMQEGDVIPLEFLQATGDNNAIFYYHPNHLASTMYVTDAQQSVVQSFLYAPYGDIISEYNHGFNGNVLPNYAFNAKELDEETGMYYYEARYYAPPVFTSRDAMFEKYFWMSPYAYCANNPVKYVDPTGKEVDVAELYRKDDKGNYVYAEQVKAFEAYMGTESGKAEVGKYAKAGQTIAGHTFESDGVYHKAGVDIAFNGEKDLPRYYDGQTGANIVNGRLKLDISTNTFNKDIGAGIEVIAHEMLIHGRQYTKDFMDNGKLDYSHTYKELFDYAKQTGNLNSRYMHHWQELNSDKVMETTGIKILQQYYNNIGSSKSRSSLLQMIKFVP